MTIGSATSINFRESLKAILGAQAARVIVQELGDCEVSRWSVKEWR